MEYDLNLNNIVNILEKHKLEAAVQSENDQVVTVFKLKDVEIPLFILLTAENKLVQLVAYLPYQLQVNTIGEVSRMLHLLNRDMDMPGFGIDERAKLIFYRLIMPAIHEKIEEKLLMLYVGTTKLACETFVIAIGQIVAGNSKVEDFIRNG